MTRAGAIGVSFSGHRRAVTQWPGGPARHTRIDPGAAFVTMSTRLDWLHVPEPSECIELYPSAQLLGQVAAEMGASRTPQLPELVATHDAVLWGLACKLRAHILGRVRLEELEIDMTIRFLLAHVLHRHGGVKLQRPPGGGLDRRRLERVVELIDSRLHELLSIRALAHAAALSPFHFARSFRVSTGLTPHNYLRYARLQRAVALARNTELATSEIAHRVGYRNVAHFRHAFVRAFGITPAVLRAQLR